MTVTELLSTLTSAGITLEANGNDLHFFPAESVSPELLAALWAHKRELLSQLSRNSKSRLIDFAGWQTYSTSDGFQVYESPSAGPRLRWSDENTSREPARPGECTRCRSTKFVDVTIHDGRSIRRECARCHLTAGFLVWYGAVDPEVASKQARTN